MGEAESEKGPVNLYPAKRIARGWATQAHQAEQGSEASMEENRPSCEARGSMGTVSAARNGKG